VLAINFGIMRRLCAASVPLLRKGTGRAIVNIASLAGLRNMDSPLDAYQVSKAAVVSLSRSLAEQLGPEGIRCNTVCPGAILTPMVESLYAESPQRQRDMELRTPLRRLGTPKDISSAVAFLLSENASFITGIDLVVDGGWIIQTVNFGLAKPTSTVPKCHPAACDPYSQKLAAAEDAAFIYRAGGHACVDSRVAAPRGSIDGWLKRARRESRVTFGSQRRELKPEVVLLGPL
jgi:hypothetical protein